MAALEEKQSDNQTDNDADTQTVDWAQCICHTPGIQSDLTAFTEVS